MPFVWGVFHSSSINFNFLQMNVQLNLVCFHALMNYKLRPVQFNSDRTKILIKLTEEDLKLLNSIYFNVHQSNFC